MPTNLSLFGFGRAIRAAVRGLWNGSLTLEEFTDQMLLALDVGFEQAWRQGERLFGVTPDERTMEEELARLAILGESATRVQQFGRFILENSKANGGKLGKSLRRAKLWVNRYNEVFNKAKQMVGGDRKMMWVLGETEHCADCLRLDGKVKRASQWKAAEIQPQMRRLACGGFNCQCQLKPTTEPMSKGPLPRV